MDITSVDKLLLAVVFFIPGFVAMKVYSIFSAGERLDASKSLVDALSFSCMIYAAFSWAIVPVYQNRWSISHPLWFTLFVVLLLFVAPASAAIALFRARTLRFFSARLPHPVGKPWDFV